MKKLLLFGLFALAMVGLNSCDKLSEDVYNSKCKIATISYDDIDMQGNNATYVYEGKDVKTIHYQNGLFLDLEYNSNRTVNKITEYNADNTPTGLTMEMAYDGKKITEVSYFDNGTLVQKYSFERNDNKNISNINILIDMETFMDGYMKNSKGIYSLSLNSEIPWEHIAKVCEKANTKGQMMELAGVTQFVNDNLSSLTIAIPMVMDIQMNYTYDNCNNPFYGMNFCAAQLNSFNRNNTTSSTTKMISPFINMDMDINMDMEIHTTSEYTYNEKNYPLTSKQTSRDITEPDLNSTFTQTFTYVE